MKEKKDVDHVIFDSDHWSPVNPIIENLIAVLYQVSTCNSAQVELDLLDIYFWNTIL